MEPASETAIQTAVKALGGGRIGGYIAVYGNPAQKDLSGEYFTPQTNFCLDWADRRPVLYNHALDPKVGTELIGTIDALHTDDIGVWAEAQLNARSNYVKAIESLVARGALSWSSGSLGHLVKKASDGRILRWPLVEASLAAQPVEPRFTGAYLVPPGDSVTRKAIHNAYKALAVSADWLDLHAESELDSETIHANAAKTLQGESMADFIEGNRTESKRLEHPSEVVAARRLPVQGSRYNPRAAVEVGDDQRYAGMTSSDLAFMTQFFADIASKDVTGRTNIGRIAQRFIYDMQTDPDRTMERRIAAKAIREVNRREGHEQTLSLLPYKSLDAVDANDYRPAIKSNELDSAAQTNYVSDWVNALWSQQIVLRQRVSNPVMGLLTRVEMPTNPFYLPVESADPTVYYMVEGTDASMLVLGSGNTVSMSKIKSNKLTLTASKIGARVGYSTEVTEDALAFVIPQFNRQMTRIMHNGIDDTLINGDTATSSTTNINVIEGTPPSTAGALPNYLALDGLRKYGLVTNTAQGYRVNGAPTLSAFRAARATLAPQYALDLPSLAYIVDVRTYFKMLAMPEFLTAQNVGLPGSALTGLLPMGNPDQLSDKPQPVGMIDGIYVYVSAQIGLAKTGAAASGGGKIDSTTSSNNTTGTALLIDRSRLFFGIKRGIQVDAFNLPYFSDTQQMLATARIALTPFDTTSAVVMYDIAVS